jgi:hypothetical protein
LYLTISAEQVLILTCKLVKHLHEVGDTGMMQPQLARKLRSFRHVSVCSRVALFLRVGIMPSTRQAAALPDTTELRLRRVM